MASSKMLQAYSAYITQYKRCVQKSAAKTDDHTVIIAI